MAALERPAEALRGLRWNEQGEHEAVLAPSWGHTVVAAFILVFNGVIFGVLAAHPQPGKHIPWYFAVFIAVVGLFLVGLLVFPLWGGQRLSFSEGVFRVRPRRSGNASLELTVAELRQFAAESDESGYRVVAVKSDGERLPLPLAFGNPLYGNSGRAAGAAARRRQERRREAEYIAGRLDRMLTEARRGHGTYRS